MFIFFTGELKQMEDKSFHWFRLKCTNDIECYLFCAGGRPGFQLFQTTFMPQLWIPPILETFDHSAGAVQRGAEHHVTFCLDFGYEVVPVSLKSSRSAWCCLAVKAQERHWCTKFHTYYSSTCLWHGSFRPGVPATLQCKGRFSESARGN